MCPPMLCQPVDIRDHTQGPRGAVVSLVEYGDYESLDCGSAHEAVKVAQAKLGEKMRFTYRHFVMTHVQPQSHRAAEAAEAAGSQQAFWRMHETLFQHQGAFTNGHLVEYADALGLDVPWFLREVVTHIHTTTINDHLRGGLGSGVESTPAFFVNGVRLETGWLGEALIDAVQRAAPAGEW